MRFSSGCRIGAKVIHLERFAFVVAGGGIALTGISSEHMGMLMALGVIIAGYAWLEWRVERIVKRELKAHTDVEVEWRTALEDKLAEIKEAVK